MKGITRRSILQRSAAVATFPAATRFARADEKRLPAIDAHAHVFHDGVIPGFLEAMDSAGIESAALLSVLCPGPGNLNAATLAVKQAAPERLYAFCCIDYRRMTESDWPDRAIEQLARCLRRCSSA